MKRSKASARPGSDGGAADGGGEARTPTRTVIDSAGVIVRALAVRTQPVPGTGAARSRATRSIMGGGSGNAVFPHVTLSVMPRRGEDGSGLLFPTAGGSANRHAGGRSAGGGRAARRSGKDAPLADRIRPETLDELLGQD